MSNKTQLQTNNASLDGYIARINAAKDIAAGLPEAGGSTDDVFDQFIEGYITDLYSNATSVMDYRFYEEFDLETVNLPQAEYINESAFGSCENLKIVNIPNVTQIGRGAFADCSPLYIMDCPRLMDLHGGAFDDTNLQALIIRNESNVVYLHTNPFVNTPIENGNGYIYVPRSMIEAYISNENWADYVDQLRVLEDYTVDGTITGELDVEFDVNTGRKLPVAILNIETNEATDTGIILTVPDDTFWHDYIFSEYNDGAWSITDDYYVVFNDEYYVYDPFSNILVTADYVITYMGDENIIILIHSDHAQELM